MTDSNRRPLVDVGIPTYGRGPYLAESIESVLGQTYPDWTLTISENGPPSDEIGHIVESYLSDPRVRYVATGTNIGGAGNSTSLLRAGIGPYVGILHDDDLWGPGFLARRVDFLEAHPECGLVFSPCDFIDDAGAALFRFDVNLSEGVQGRKMFLRRLYRGNLICAPTALVRRESYELVGPTFSESLLFWDYEMWLRIAANYAVGYLEQVDAFYRVHAAQATQDNRLRVGDHRLALLAEAEKIVAGDFPKIERRRANSKALVRTSLDAFGEGNRRKAIQRLVLAVRAHPAAPVDPVMISAAIRRLKRRKQRRALRRAGLTL
jgi:GT2 family glycosyltransferase